MTTTNDNLIFARRYLAAIESGATGDVLAAFFTPDVVQEEFPNRLVVNGAKRGLAEILDGAVRGQRVVGGQRFEILSELAVGDRVVLETQWSATINVPFGSLPVGGSMRARFAMFLDFRGGKIAAQRNYDCFEPF